ncbi:F-box/kelch-repeat protein At3g06240-like [Salvia hispanica]|uniref:F-box/kelch-repeat protein At3g06240-like n=1 Tax=Salvia hispanica TaxID=49212 RepID=UPI0020097B23|nr:F-box/kelch-repeat protein At3g06240-like [Salvia hispanica]
MGTDMNDLPPGITIDILSRLPVRTIMNSICVCRSWRDLVKSPYFASLHSRQAALSPARLPAFKDLRFSRAYSFLGFIGDNELILKPPKGSVLSHHFPNPNKPFIHSSLNGLLFMIDMDSLFEVFVCNPITREYVRIDMGRKCEMGRDMGRKCKSKDYSFGFGMSKSGRYKIVRIFAHVSFPITCQVHTLGMKHWKSITIDSQLELFYQMDVPYFMNGNLHWLTCTYADKSNPPRVYCIDLETELFNYFSCPPSIQHCQRSYYYALSVLGGCLSLSNDDFDNKVEIWCMKEYGDDKSWTKDYVIKRKPRMLKLPDIFYCLFQGRIRYNIHDVVLDVETIEGFVERQNLFHDTLYPVKAFEDGGVLLALERSSRLFYYSNVTKAIQEIKKERNHNSSNIVIHSPSLVSLKSLVMENMRVEYIAY